MNGISKIALFIWAMKTPDVTPKINAFCSLHEMHPQFKSVIIDGAMVSEYFGCCGFKPCHDACQIALAMKNKWHDDWLKP